MNASRQMLRNSTSLLSAAAARTSSSRCAVATAARPFAAPQSSPSSFLQFSSPFSTSARTLSDSKESTEKAKAAEDAAAGEAMGTESNKPAGEQSAESETDKKLAEKDKLIKELKDQVLYGKADLQNAQRRAKEEKEQASTFAISKLARDLTSSLDVLALALRSVPEPLRTNSDNSLSSEDPRKAVAELYSGVELTQKSILDMLKTHGVVPFDPTGEKFNPNEHEAMFQAPIPDKEPGTVLECSKIGYKLKDRVLRAAQVGVVQG